MNTPGHDRLRRSLGCLWHFGLSVLLAGSCCPEVTAESCATLEQWRQTDRCRDFPSATDGAQYPSAGGYGTERLQLAMAAALAALAARA